MLIKAQLARENTWRASRGLVAVDSVDKVKPDELPDPLLETAASVALEFSRIGPAGGAVVAQAKADEGSTATN